MLMRTKGILSAALAAALTVALALPAGAASSSFTDVKDPATAVNADVLRLMGVVDGVGGNTFNPSGSLTRAEFCAMVVKFMQQGDLVPLHATRTIFSDVTASHWGLGYVNLAASLTVKDGEKEVPLISGVGDGRFEPDAKITLGQAATILIRVLGYSSQQAGAVWPQSYMNLASSIGLTDGISAGTYDNITRAQAAQLFVNALSCKTGSGGEYYQSLGTPKEDVVLLAVNVDTDDGSAQGAVRTSGGTYLPHTEDAVPTALQGSRGALVLNDKQEIVTFVPDDSTATTITLSGDAEATYVKGTDGKQYTIASDTPVYTSDKTEGDSYVSAHTSLYSGTQITMFSQRGKVVAVYASGGMSASDVGAVVVSGNASDATFYALTGGATNLKAQKNRQSIPLSYIKNNDVVTYDSLSNTLIVSDLRLTCILESAYPSSKAPEKITALGHEVPVLESAWTSTPNFNVGSQVTLLLTADGKVAGMAEPGKVPSTAIGMVSQGSAQVFLPNGGTLDLKGEVSRADELANRLVTVTSGAKGKIGASPLPSKSASGAFQVDSMTLSGYTVTAGVRLYEQVSGGAMVGISLADLGMASIPANQVATYHLNTSGMVDFLVLNEVTGNGYQYGIAVSNVKEEVKIPLVTSQTITNPAGEEITIQYEVERDAQGNPRFDSKGEPIYKLRQVNAWGLVNSHGVTAIGTTGNGLKANAFGGVALDNNGKPIATVELTSVGGVSPSDIFQSQGKSYVTVGGKTYRIADDVECYYKVAEEKGSPDNWFTQSTGQERLDACKAFSKDLTLYVDPVGQQVRVIQAN